MASIHITIRSTSLRWDWSDNDSVHGMVSTSWASFNSFLFLVDLLVAICVGLTKEVIEAVVVSVVSILGHKMVLWWEHFS